MLNLEEKKRYNRHILLSAVGESGQEKLKKASVLVIGAGGLGCPILQYLTAAGVGTIGIIDFDVVEESNLQRQILFTTQDIGKNKALVASERLKNLNPFVKFDSYQEKLSVLNALDLFKNYDIIVDGTDNFSTRYLVNDAAILTNKPFVSGSIFKFEGQISVFNYKNGPSYRCLFPVLPTKESIPNCSEVGVIGILAGIIGTQQANEVIKIILEIGEVLSGKLLVYNALKVSYSQFYIQKNEQEILRVKNNKSNFETLTYETACSTLFSNEINVEELKNMLASTNDIQLIDVREEHELPKLPYTNVWNIPMNSLLHQTDKISKTKTVVVFCQHGIRSKYAIELLEEEGFTNLINLKGGIVRF